MSVGLKKAFEFLQTDRVSSVALVVSVASVVSVDVVRSVVAIGFGATVDSMGVISLAEHNRKYSLLQRPLRNH